ncbi:MAG: radical SAM protein [Holophaga sp.]|nr:radical SAM protein [Holophaga sp.]
MKPEDGVPDSPAQALRPWPHTINIIQASACNLKCAMCYAHGPFVEKPPSGVMPQATFERIVREAGPQVKAISLTNWGEPFLDPLLAERLAVIRDFPQVELQFQTNGTLLDRKHLSMLRDQPNPVRFAISVDAVNPALYASIRAPGHFATLLRNLRLLKRHASELGFQIAAFDLSATLMVRNIADAPNLVKLAAEVGASGVRLWHMSSTDPSLREESLFRIPVYTNRVLEHCRALAESLGIVPDIAQPFATTPEEMEQARPGQASCDLIEQMLQISPAGEVWPCCGNLPPIGHLDTGASLAEIWGGAEHLRLREALFQGRPTGRCKGCRYLERLTPFLFDSSKYGVDIPPEERCMDQEPDLEALGAFRWLDEMPEATLRRSVHLDLLETARNSAEPARSSTRAFRPVPDPGLPLEALNRKVDLWLRAGAKVALAPAGNFLSRLLNGSRLAEVDPVVILDRNPFRYGATFRGYPLRTYAEAQAFAPSVILVASPAFEADICRTLAPLEQSGVEVVRFSEL